MDEKAATIPYFAHEGAMARMERTNRRLWILVLVLVLALIGSNAGWIYRETHSIDEEYTYEISQDSSDGGQNTYTDNIINLGGEYYGEADDPRYSKTEDPN